MPDANQEFDFIVVRSGCTKVLLRPPYTGATRQVAFLILVYIYKALLLIYLEFPGYL